MSPRDVGQAAMLGIVVYLIARMIAQHFANQACMKNELLFIRAQLAELRKDADKQPDAANHQP